MGQKHVQAMALVIALAIGLLVGAAPAPAAGLSGAELFSNHCAGCHVNGGNIIRRGQTLKLGALERHGLDGPAGILEIAVAGRGQMAGYGAVLGETGAEAVAAYVWQQALLDWPRG
ncbi:c-type cytochrome [Synechococcus sp. CBW1108]|uniref:c-type cytochrome n=1 Tax=Synechococcus sp. CBW1108 TaxID=1353147 RepID=UPI001E5E99C0|nr:c-type cytochrome [Synechococcus sp. CBW1108]